MGTIPPGLVLPYYARPDLAWEETKFFPGQVASTGFAYHTATGYIDTVVSVYTEYQVNSVVQNRHVRLAWIQDPNLDIATATAGVTLSVLGEYFITFTTDVAAYSGTVGNDIVAPMQRLIMYPNYSMYVVFDNAHPTDTLVQSSITVLHIPTGPRIEDEMKQRTLIPRTLLH